MACALVACAAAAPQFPQQQQARRQQTYSPYSPSSSASGAPAVNIALTRSSPEQPIVILKQVQDFALPGTYSYR